MTNKKAEKAARKKASKRGPYIRATFMYAGWKGAREIFKCGEIVEYEYANLKALGEDLMGCGKETGHTVLEDCIDNCGWAFQYVNGDSVENLTPQSLAAMIRIMG